MTGGELVEEVARAICEALGDDPEREGPFAQWYAESPYRPAADAAIAIVVERCARVFSEDVVKQCTRLRVPPVDNETPGQWMQRVRHAAILSLSPAVKD
jgi:hypothetical protein